MDVKLNWTANPAEEAVTGYNVYKDGALLAVAPANEYNDVNVAAGLHSYEVAAVNIWGEGPHSDPVSTPAAASKVGGVTIQINVSVSVG